MPFQQKKILERQVYRPMFQNYFSHPTNKDGSGWPWWWVAQPDKPVGKRSIARQSIWKKNGVFLIMTIGLTTMVNCNLTTLESKTVWIVDKKQWSRTVNGCQNELSCTRNSRCRYSRSIYTLGCTVTWSVRRACAPRIPNHSPLALPVTSRKINVIGDKMFRLQSDPTSPIRTLSIGNYLKITYHNIPEGRRYNLEITTMHNQ